MILRIEINFVFMYNIAISYFNQNTVKINISNFEVFCSKFEQNGWASEKFHTSTLISALYMLHIKNHGNFLGNQGGY